MSPHFTTAQIIERVENLRREMNFDGRPFHRDTCDLVLALLDAGKFVIVPKEPTEAMQEAVGAELERQHVAMDEFSEPLFGAMIEAYVTPNPNPPSHKSRREK